MVETRASSILNSAIYSWGQVTWRPLLGILILKTGEMRTLDSRAVRGKHRLSTGD